MPAISRSGSFLICAADLPDRRLPGHTVLHPRCGWGGVDLVILQDASASMRVKDMQGDRWQRSMKFLRLLGDSLSWKSDRIALAVFAHIAAPQIRLTTESQHVFFFLDHLDKEPPFRIRRTRRGHQPRLGIHWGLRMMERTRRCTAAPRMRRCSSCCRTASSGAARSRRPCGRRWRNIPVFVVASARSREGGCRPSSDPTARRSRPQPQRPPGSMRRAAEACRVGRRSVFRAERDGDRRIANALIDTGKRIAPSIGLRQDAEESCTGISCFMAAALLLRILFVRIGRSSGFSSPECAGP